MFPLLLAGSAESFIRLYPNAFSSKAAYIKNHSEVEVLILGSSHSQQAINPEFLTVKASNLAYNGQDLAINTAMFYHYVEDLPFLRYLIVEMDYHTLEFRQPKDYFRNAWYYQYHNLKLAELPLMQRYFMYPTAPKFFNHYLLEQFDRDLPVTKLNQWGFETNRFAGDFEQRNYDVSAIATFIKSTPKRHLKISLENLNDSKQLINGMLNLCNKKDIRMVLVSTPMYPTFERHKTVQKEQHRVHFIDSLLKAHPEVIYFNFENDHRFTVSDFRDEDHLNPTGAKKFTGFIDALLKRLKN